MPIYNIYIYTNTRAQTYTNVHTRHIGVGEYAQGFFFFCIQIYPLKIFHLLNTVRRWRVMKGVEGAVYITMTRNSYVYTKHSLRNNVRVQYNYYAQQGPFHNLLNTALRF